MSLKSINWVNSKIKIINQNKLPSQLVYEDLKTLDDVSVAIKEMKVRGAPLIGVTAALGLTMIANQNLHLNKNDFISTLENAGMILKSTRPTAVNLCWAIDTVLSSIKKSTDPYKTALNQGIKIFEDDLKINKQMAIEGHPLIDNQDVLLTHCNTGSLATAGIGTALGVIIESHKMGKQIKVYATETRPKLQGAKLTMFELLQAGIDAVLISDSAVGYTIKKKKIKKIFTGADRILSDGTVYNKIGTYQISVLARYHNIPFYVVAPLSTFDFKSSVSEIKIEERAPEEVTKINNSVITPLNAEAYNPAFDITPPENITGIITEKGIIYEPFKQNIKSFNI